ncbi:MAG: CBS domain-containing protein [Gammaproteobacteria bacterium]|nr:CBS domain-containing protein [Gammaproteobacteria bacterium]
MEIDLNNCVVDDSASIKEALNKIEENHRGFVFTIDAAEKVTGLATDGDIRRALIDGISLDDAISSCSNTDFLWASTDESREQLLKKLDSRIQFIPVLDSAHKLKYIVSNNFVPLTAEQDVYIRARAPVRMSFGGGGSDLTHYFKDSAGAVINAAISIYSNGVMRVRSDSKIIINSQDLNATLNGDNLEDALLQEGPFGLIQSILHVVQPTFGFELSLYSDFSVGSGLGGSATLSAVVLGCLNRVRKDPWNQYELAEIAFQAERLHLGIAGGWQDQYASVFGGFNFIEFNKDENIVNPIRVHADIISELEESLVLCDTGIGHHSGNIHEDQKETMSSSVVKEMVNANVKLTYSIHKHLLRGDLEKFGECLDASWQLKRNFSSMISNDNIDAIYTGALANSALGGKLLGAGGGGYFIFYVRPFEKFQLLDYLKSNNLTVQKFRFELEGLKTWSRRDY